MKRLSPLFAAIAVAASLAVPAFASAAPVNLTNWSPVRSDLQRAGNWQTVAVNPSNGNQLVAFFQDDSGVESYSVGVWNSDGSAVGSIIDIAGNDVASAYMAPKGAYNPETGGWIVIYYDENLGDYVAQLLDADGSMSGSAHVISSSPNVSCCGSPSIAWDSAKEQFFAVWAEYSNGNPDGQPQARFVNPSTGLAVGSGPIDLVTNPDDFVWDDYHSAAVAYSSKHDGFGLMFRGKLQSGGNWRPYFIRLDSNGEPTGAPQMISSGSDLEVTNGSIAYSKSADQYAVAWADYSEIGTPVLVQRVNAGTGAFVGTPVTQPVPVDADTTRRRIQIAANALGPGYAITSFATNGTTSSSEAYALWLDGSAQPVGTPAWISGDLTNVTRPQIGFDGQSGCFRVSYIATDSTGSAADIYSTEVGTSSVEDCATPPSGKKPTLKKSGNAGSTSLRVKVGCGGASACRIKLSGKLKGGSGKLQGKTVKVKAGKKKLVTLDYSDSLISELVGRSGSKIKVTAKQVGGKSRTITVAVPDSVTG